MEKIINNEGKEILVSAEVYELLKADYADGIWSILIRVNNKVHCIILPENF